MTATRSTKARTARLRLGLSLRELANELATKGALVDFSQLSRIENGLYAPRPKLRKALCEVLDLEPEDLDVT